MNEELLTVTEFAKKIKASRLTVLRMIWDGRIIALRLSDADKSPYRIKGSEVERLISWGLDKREKEV